MKINLYKPKCKAPVPGGCGREVERVGLYYRTLCSVHRIYKYNNIPLQTPVVIKEKARRLIPKDGNLYIYKCYICSVEIKKTYYKPKKIYCRNCYKKSYKDRKWRPPKINLLEKNISDYLNGKSPEEIGKEIGFSGWTVTKALKRAGIKTRSQKEAGALVDKSKFLSRVKELRESGELNKIVSAALQGIPRNQWCGFIKDESQRLQLTNEWKEWRNIVFKRDGYTCIFCGSKKSPFDPHHIKKKSKYPKLIYDSSNGVTLCRKCHMTTLGKEEEFEEKCYTYLESLGVKIDRDYLKTLQEQKTFEKIKVQIPD